MSEIPIRLNRYTAKLDESINEVDAMDYDFELKGESETENTVLGSLKVRNDNKDAYLLAQLASLTIRRRIADGKTED